MPRSTIAVSLLAVFLLGVLVGGGRTERAAVAGPTSISTLGGSGEYFATDADGRVATMWTVMNGQVTRATRYWTGGAPQQDTLGSVEMQIGIWSAPKPSANGNTPPK